MQSVEPVLKLAIMAIKEHEKSKIKWAKSEPIVGPQDGLQISGLITPSSCHHTSGQCEMLRAPIRQIKPYCCQDASGEERLVLHCFKFISVLLALIWKIPN